MTIQRYEIFNKVVQLKNITKAGDELNITQSGISQGIKSLEDELNLNLLNRHKNGIKLTREGEIIHQHTQNIMRAHNELFQEVSALHGLETGVVNVGTFSSVTTHWLPNILYNLHSGHLSG